MIAMTIAAVLFATILPEYLQSTRKLQQSILDIYYDALPPLEKKVITAGRGARIELHQTGTFLYEGWIHDQFQQNGKGKHVLFKTRQNIQLSPDPETSKEDWPVMPGLIYAAVGMIEGQMIEVIIPSLLIRKEDFKNLKMTEKNSLLLQIKFERLLK